MPRSPAWFGLLNVNKPAGWTSRRVVDHVQRLISPAKIGHAGTLDPLATGVLVLCLGPATRLVPYLHDLPKAYRAEFLLGCRSESDDVETEIETLADAPTVTREQIESALPQFLGTITQVPPAYSAVKIHGRRAYELARKGRQAPLKPRIIEVHSLRVLGFAEQKLTLEIVCGSGTYIRSLGRDLAESLGTGAVMSRLVRTRIGPFDLETSVSPEEITVETLAGQVQPPQSGLTDMPIITATDEMLARLRRGLCCRCPDSLATAENAEVAVLSPSERLATIAEVVGRELQPRHVFPTE